MNAFDSEDLARKYQAFTDLMRTNVERWVIEQLTVMRDPTFGLDLGCGTGRYTHILRRFCPSVLGVDSSATMIKLAEQDTSSGITYRVAGLLEVTAPADVVLCAFTAHHAGPPAEVFAHIESLVLPGGLALVVDMVDPGGWGTRSFHEHRAAEVAARARVQFGPQGEQVVTDLFTDPAWQEMVMSSRPLTSEEFVRHAAEAFPGSAVTSFAGSMHGVAWRKPNPIRTGPLF